MNCLGAVALTATIAVLSSFAAPVRAAPAVSDAQIVAEATRGELKALRGRYFDKGCDATIEYDAKVVDLNDDGQPEVFTQQYGSCFGLAGVELNLYIRDGKGRWRSQFGFPGFYELLSTRSLGYPDIKIGGPGDCAPVWRWNGQKYALYKRCAR